MSREFCLFLLDMTGMSLVISNQQQMAELFATSKQLISHHIANILKDKELDGFSVVKQYLTTAADGKNYNVVFYSLEMIIKKIFFRIGA